MKKILITAANSDISIGIARILRCSYPKALLIGVAPDGQWPGAHFFDHVFDIPLVSDFSSYKQVLEEIIIKYDVDVLCPVSEKELYFFYANAYKPIKFLLMNPNDVLDNFLDKYRTYIWLKSINVSVPETFLLSDERAKSIGNSIFKPRSSAGSKNMYQVDNDILFDAVKYTHRNNIDNFVVQRNIGSMEDEYTCALWRFNGEYRSIILKRKLQGGLTGEAEVSSNPEIEKLLKEIERNIKGDFFINVQLRIEQNIPFVFEINPRFSSTIMLRHKIGFQDVLWSFQSILKEESLAYFEPSAGTKLFRIANELIV